jgi:hypothetical protein
MTNKELAELIEQSYKKFNIAEDVWYFNTKGQARNCLKVCPAGAAFIGAAGSVEKAELDWDDCIGNDEYEVIAAKVGVDISVIRTISKTHVRRIYTAAQIIARLKSDEFEADIKEWSPQV